MEFICPLPYVWAEIYDRLYSAWQERGSKGDPPPIPLILSGWVFSNDLDKKIRWEMTLQWAREQGLEHLIPEIESHQAYKVMNVTTYNIGPMGGPMYLRWDYSKKTTPSIEQVNEAFQLLTSKWQEIAGPEMALHTKPLKFTGKRRRRLLVLADPNFSPPWGSWEKLAPNETRRHFTRFRKAVNEVISPLIVDHIDFIISSEPFEQT